MVHLHMGVRGLFLRGGQNFPGGGQKHTTVFAFKTPKKMQFFFKKFEKHSILARHVREVKGPLLPFPADAHLPTSSLGGARIQTKPLEWGAFQ